MPESALTIVPVILSGGSGTRLWPSSRALHPKQLLPMLGQQSMLQATMARFHGEAGFGRALVVGGEEHRFLIKDQLAEGGEDPAAIILEPEGRNTAAAIALAAHAALALHQDPVLVVAPSDHAIADVEGFRAAIRTAAAVAQDGLLVTLGVKPTSPETGYGYIEMGKPLPGQDVVRAVSRFLEKPAPAVAETLFADGRHAWNAGLFVLKARVYLEELAAHAPAIADGCAAAMARSVRDGPFIRPDAEIFRQVPNISIDYAVMEPTRRAAVVPIDIGWSDVGSWDALWSVSEKDGGGNSFHGEVVAIDTQGCLVRADAGIAVATVGVRDMAVVATRDSVLVMPRSRSQDVKAVVDELKANGSSRHLEQPVVHRPWGTYQTTDRGERFQTKRIVVKPGAQLSSQMHHHRSEHWVVVSGTAVVTIDGRKQVLGENQSVYIAAGTQHRLSNPGTVPLHLIEVQCGPYLGEDDIVRFEDDYARVPAAPTAQTTS